MGLTLIRKSDPARRKRNPKVALVLAGGAVSGGAFKVGGLKALNDFMVGRGITDLDIYVGLSAGSLLSIPLAAGIDPDEMVKVLDGTSTRFEQLRPIDFYSPNWREFAERPAKLAFDLFTYLPGVTVEFVRALPGLPNALGAEARKFLRKPSYTGFERLSLKLMDQISPVREVPNLTNHIPSGLFDNASLERWMRLNLEKIGISNDFHAFERETGKKIYISACDLDTAERAVFGTDEISDVSLSEAMQASCALPGFYRPARVNGIDYVDGGVRNTANIDIAIEKGADLVVCYNPFRPFLNRIDSEGDESPYFANGRYLSDRGLKMVANQVFRTLLHSRLKLGIQRYLSDDRFDGDIVLLEPREQDEKFFSVNPVAFWKRSEAVEHGFESVRHTIEKNFSQLEEVFGHYGIELSQDAARRKAARARKARGWQAAEEAPGTPGLRLVG